MPLQLPQGARAAASTATPRTPSQTGLQAARSSGALRSHRRNATKRVYRTCQPVHLVDAPTSSSETFVRSLAVHVTGHNHNVPVGNVKYAPFVRTQGDFTLHLVTKPTNIKMHAAASICTLQLTQGARAAASHATPHTPQTGRKQPGRAGHFGRNGATRRSACIGMPARASGRRTHRIECDVRLFTCRTRDGP